MVAVPTTVEGDLVAIRRPHRNPVPVVVVGELLDLSPVGVHHVDLMVAVPVALKGDLVAVTPITTGN